MFILFILHIHIHMFCAASLFASVKFHCCRTVPRFSSHTSSLLEWNDSLCKKKTHTVSTHTQSINCCPIICAWESNCIEIICSFRVASQMENQLSHFKWVLYVYGASVRYNLNVCESICTLLLHTFGSVLLHFKFSHNVNKHELNAGACTILDRCMSLKYARLHSSRYMLLLLCRFFRFFVVLKFDWYAKTLLLQSAYCDAQVQAYNVLW